MDFISFIVVDVDGDIMARLSRRYGECVRVVGATITIEGNDVAVIAGSYIKLQGQAVFRRAELRQRDGQGCGGAGCLVDSANILRRGCARIKEGDVSVRENGNGVRGLGAGDETAWQYVRQPEYNGLVILIAYVVANDFDGKDKILAGRGRSEGHLSGISERGAVVGCVAGQVRGSSNSKVEAEVARHREVHCFEFNAYRIALARFGFRLGEFNHLSQDSVVLEYERVRVALVRSDNLPPIRQSGRRILREREADGFVLIVYVTQRLEHEHRGRVTRRNRQGACRLVVCRGRLYRERIGFRVGDIGTGNRHAHCETAGSGNRIARAIDRGERSGIAQQNGNSALPARTFRPRIRIYNIAIIVTHYHGAYIRAPVLGDFGNRRRRKGNCVGHKLIIAGNCDDEFIKRLFRRVGAPDKDSGWQGLVCRFRECYHRHLLFLGGVIVDDAEANGHVAICPCQIDCQCFDRRSRFVDESNIIRLACAGLSDCDDEGNAILGKPALRLDVCYGDNAARARRPTNPATRLFQRDTRCGKADVNVRLKGVNNSKIVGLVFRNASPIGR